MLGGGGGLFPSAGALRVGALSVSLLCLRPWESPEPPCLRFCTPPSGCFPFEARVCRVPVLGVLSPGWVYGKPLAFMSVLGSAGPGRCGKSWSAWSGQAATPHPGSPWDPPAPVTFCSAWCPHPGRPPGSKQGQSREGLSFSKVPVP